MKTLSTLMLGAMLLTGAAFAATAPTATPATQAQPAQKHSAMHCEKQAKEKKLTGSAEKEFVKECREGKKS